MKLKSFTIPKQNKKADIMLIVILIGIMFLLLIAALGMVFGAVIIDWVADETVPMLSGLGTIDSVEGSANLTEYASYTIKPVNSVIQSFTWLTGVFYLLALMICFGLAVSFRITGGKWLIAFFIVCMFLLIITSIFISNIYEEFYNDGSEIGQRLHEHVLISWLLLYSPMVISIVGFICGIIMFSGDIENV